MTDSVFVPFGDDRGATATLLLAAAEGLDLEPGVVTVDHFSGSGGYRAPAEVVEAAGLDTEDPDAAFLAEVESHLGHEDDDQYLNVTGQEVAGEKVMASGPSEAEPKPVAKKTAAKKTAAKKTASKS